MPIQPMTFQPLSFDQANPFLTGMGKGEQLVNDALDSQQKSLANQLAKAVLPYAAPQSQADLQKMQLANQLSQATLPYAAPQAAADLSRTQAQVPLMQAQTGEANAQTGLIGQQTKYYPLEALIKAQNANQSSSRFGQAYQLAKTLSEMPAPTRATWIAQNQDSYNQMVADIANGKNQNQSFITPQIMQQYFPGMQQQQAPQPPAPQQGFQQPPGTNPIPSYLMQQQLQAQQQAKAMQQTQPSMPQQRFANPTQELNDLTRQASMMSANKDLTTAATRRQMEGAIQVEGIVNDPRIQQQVVNAAQYAGVVGKGDKAIAALSQKNPQAYEAYLSLKNQTMPLLQNRIKTLDQMGGTDKQREELQGLYDKTMDSLTSNPSQFVGQFNALTKTLDTIAKSVQVSSSPIFDVNRLSGVNQIQNPYQPPNAPAPQPQAQQVAGALNQTGQSKVIGGKTYTKINGQWYEQ